MRPLIIGQAPGRGDGEPLSGKAGRRLSALCGLPLPVYLGLFDRINLIDHYPGDRFPRAEARMAALGLAEIMASRRRVVLLGREIARALGHRSPFFEWSDAFRDGRTFVALSPHPSGRSLWWNDPANVDQARAF